MAKKGDATISVDKGKSYTVSIKNHIFGTSAELSETGDSVPNVNLMWDAARKAYTTDKALASGKYTVSVDGGAVGKISVKNGEIAYARSKPSPSSSKTARSSPSAPRTRRASST